MSDSVRYLATGVTAVSGFAAVTILPAWGIMGGVSFLESGLLETVLVWLGRGILLIVLAIFCYSIGGILDSEDHDD